MRVPSTASFMHFSLIAIRYRVLIEVKKENTLESSTGARGAGVGFAEDAPFGCPWETKFASKFNLETISKAYALCTPKNTFSETILGPNLNLLQYLFSENSITLSKLNAKWKSFKTPLFSQ